MFDPHAHETRSGFLRSGLSDPALKSLIPDEPRRFAMLAEAWELANPPAVKVYTPIEVTKFAEEKRLAYGWFTVIEKDGEVVVDSQGDIITEDELLRLVHGFSMGSRAAKVMHGGRRVGDVVELLCLTRDVQKALGRELDRAGAFGAMKIYSDEAWKRFKSGELQGFSWGGFAGRKRVSA